MAQAKKGDKVLVYYTGYLKNGTVFDSSSEEKPFEFTIGQVETLPRFENAVIGMNEGDKKTVSINPEDAFGHYDKGAVAVVEKSKLPDGVKPEIGMKLQARTHEGIVKMVTIIEINEDTITVDCNHSLAGQKLTFEIHLLKIF